MTWAPVCPKENDVLEWADYVTHQHVPPFSTEMQKDGWQAILDRFKKYVEES